MYHFNKCLTSASTLFNCYVGAFNSLEDKINYEK